ncbi:MAG: hypothetical protein PHV95_05465 [Eubacteriales bacterium]|nr:hypothetical protein [Eubacteriales bacterium]
MDIIMKRKKLFKKILIISLVVLFITGSTLGIVYYVQGKSSLDWAASRIEKDYKMTSLYNYHNIYLVSSDLIESSNEIKILKEELLMTEDEAYKFADEFVKKYNINEGCDYKILVRKRDTFNLDQYVKGSYYTISIDIDKSYPDIVLNKFARRKFVVELAIDDDGILYVGYF